MCVFELMLKDSVQFFLQSSHKQINCSCYSAYKDESRVCICFIKNPTWCKFAAYFFMQ